MDSFDELKTKIILNRLLWKLASSQNFLILSKIYRITSESLALTKLKKFEVNFTKIEDCRT